jgi:hypothetical protein
MEQEFFNNYDSLEVICLLVSLFVVIVAIYRWLMIKWQSEVNLRKYVFMHALPDQRLDLPFSVTIDVPVEQEVQVSVRDSVNKETEVLSKVFIKGSHEFTIPMTDLKRGEYMLVLKSEGQEDMKKFAWEPH